MSKCLTISQVENGFIIDRENSYDDDFYGSQRYVYTNWDGVVDYIKSNELKFIKKEI